jgi:alanine-synthesizing transaminase
MNFELLETDVADQEFATWLREAMGRCGLKQVDLVRIASNQGVKLGKSQLSQYLSGKTVPRAGMRDFLVSTLEGQPISTQGEAQPTAGKQAAQVKIELSAQAGSHQHSMRKAQQEVTPMRQFKKSSKLDNVSYDVRGPVLDEAMRMEEEGTTILKLNIGNPAPFGFRAVDEVVHDMSAQLIDTEGYSDSRGLWAARKAIMQYDQLKGIPNVTMNDIYTGNGVSELINLVMQALVETGDEILVPSPDYPLWTACVSLAGGTPVHYLCDENDDWNPNIDDIRSKVTSHTKAIVVINPNNPTGAVYPKEVLQQIVEVAREHQLIIIADEIYDRLCMDGVEHTSIASLAPDLFCITMNGLSKSHMIAGWRIGWMSLSGNKRCARDLIEGINIMSNMRLCSNVPAQSVVQTALGGHQSVKGYVMEGGRVRNQRDYVYERLNAIPGVSVVKPKAAFYIFPKLDPERFNISDDDQFALDLLQEQKVLVVGGKGFNWFTPGYFRIVYLPRRAILGEAIDKLEVFLSHYRQ